MTEGRSSDAIGPVEELRWLAASVDGLDAAAAAALWGDDEGLVRAVADARSELATVGAAHATGGTDIAAVDASARWKLRAERSASDAAEQRGATSDPEHAVGDAVLAVAVARTAIAEAVLAVAHARRVTSAQAAAPPRRWNHHVGALGGRVAALGYRILLEIRHIVADKPRAVLARTVITLAVSLSLVALYYVVGMKRYDISGLTLYLFSAVIGSMVCTNALCFEAERVRAGLVRGERIWRILVAKNLAMATLITAAGFPVVAALTWTVGTNPVVLADQLVTMVFIWLGVGNVLSVVWPLRHEPMPARLRDGTWKPFLFTFVISYGVGLTVNLMIYWRLWAREAANAELAGGAWAAFLLVLASAVLSWLLLTVFAVACGREPAVRRKLSRELVAYRKPTA